ncbi:MAG: [Fe-S]-binding protein, partial [Sphingobacteriaceae bacterium]
MGNIAAEFLVAAEEKSFDMDHRHIINNNMSKYDVAVENTLQRFANLETAKRKAHVIKWKTIE